MTEQNEVILRSLSQFLPQLKNYTSAIFEEIKPSGYHYHYAILVNDGGKDFFDIGFCTVTTLLKSGRVNLKIKETYERFTIRHPLWNHRKVHEGIWKYPF